jgi:hypothetical protein
MKIAERAQSWETPRTRLPSPVAHTLTVSARKSELVFTDHAGTERGAIAYTGGLRGRLLMLYTTGEHAGYVILHGRLVELHDERRVLIAVLEAAFAADSSLSPWTVRTGASVLAKLQTGTARFC